MPAATDCRLAWDIVNRGVADYGLLAMLFQVSQAKGRLSKGSTSSSLAASAGTQDAEGNGNDDDNDDDDDDDNDDDDDDNDDDDDDNDDDDDDNDKDDLNADTDSENAVPAFTNQAMSKTPSKSPLSSAGSLSLAANAGSLNQKKQSAQPDIASIVVNCMDRMGHPIENKKGAYGSLSESAQLQAQVAEKVEDILSKCNGEFDGAMCEWLKEELTLKYNKLFADTPLRAAAFLGTRVEGLSVKYLTYLWQVEICEK
ncbi:hypothetical protein BJ741DRAFT_707474 [Chytriomyces cf. hyalinus JEL632]|nr:hypothetical protein BJ741DRAFT_707474 [Chytriomyces cf. hyalinus JEL632]